MRYFSSILLIFLLSSFVFSQETQRTNYQFSGYITDKDNKVLDFVQVTILSKNNNTIAYTMSDELGYYYLSFKSNSDSVFLHVSRLAYIPKSVKLAVVAKGHNFVMQESKSSHLEEIVVTDNESAIYENEDTVRYLARSFTDGTEVNVEDVLAKLPGLTVDKSNGQIKYQGKEIKKILLDGDDLTDNNYKVVSKSLSADWLDKIEILNRFSDNRLLKGIEQSTDVAINLKLKESVKSPFFGSITAAVGNTNKYKGKGELLSYLKRLKILTTTEANNTGDELESYSLETYNSSQMEYRGFLSADRVLNNELGSPDFLKEENFTFHEGQFLSNSMLIKYNPKFKIRSMTTFYHNNKIFDFSDDISYILPNNKTFDIFERQQQKQKPLSFFQDFKFDYQLNRKTDISSVWQFKNDNLNLQSVNKSSGDVCFENSDSKNLQLYGKVSLTQRLNNNWASVTEFQMNIEKHNEKIGLSEVYIPHKDSVNQVVNQQYRNFGISNNLTAKMGNGFLFNILSALTYSDIDLNIMNSLMNVYINKKSPFCKYKYYNYFVDFNITKKFKNFKIRLGSRFRIADVDFQKRKRKFLIEPSVMLSSKNRWFDILKSEIKLFYNTEYTFLKSPLLIRKPLISSYRSKIGYIGDAFKPIKTDLYAFSLKISENNYSYVNGNIQLAYSKSSNALLGNAKYEDNFVYNTKVQNDNVNSFISSYSIDKMFLKLRTSIKLSYEYTYEIYPLTIETIKANNELINNSLNISLGCVLIKNTSISLSYRYRNIKNTWNDDNSDFSFDNYVVKVRFKPCNALSFIVDYQAVNFKNNAEGLSYFMSSYVKYEMRKKKLSFKLSMNNLFDNSSVVLQNLEPTFYAISNYPLQSRFFLFSVKYQFSTINR